MYNYKIMKELNKIVNLTKSYDRVYFVKEGNWGIKVRECAEKFT